MVGSLIKFSCDKRELFFPSQPLYHQFDGAVGLVISYTKKPVSGKESVRVRWVKPVVYHGRNATVSDFDLLNFEVVSASL